MLFIDIDPLYQNLYFIQGVKGNGRMINIYADGAT